MPARKTVDVRSMIDYANGFLAAKGGTKESRYGVICMIEALLFKANRYYGFVYLGEKEVSPDDLPGIRWADYVPGVDLSDGRFENTDPTRRRYA